MDDMIERTVLLFSQGLDSFIMSKLIPHDLKLFILTGTQDNAIEHSKIVSLQEDTEIATLDLSFLAQFELRNKIIPFRNMFFAAAAAQYGSKILMASTKGDSTRDKDEVFSYLMSGILSYFSTGPKEKVVHPAPCRVELPFRQYTKRELVARYISAGFPTTDLVYKSSSCYYPSDSKIECGQCRSCLRKFTALFLNGVIPQFGIPDERRLQLHLEDSILKGRGSEELDIRETLKILTVI